MDEQPASEPAVDLDIRGLRTWVGDIDGDLVLRVDDGDVLVEFEPGLTGSWQHAVDGARRLASAALQYAEALQRRGVPYPPASGRDGAR